LLEFDVLKKCEKRGQIYFLIYCHAESFYGGGIKYAQDGRGSRGLSRENKSVPFSLGVC